MNTFKTAFLLTALTLVLMLIGGHFGGRNGMILAFIVAAGCVSAAISATHGRKRRQRREADECCNHDRSAHRFLLSRK